MTKIPFLSFAAASVVGVSLALGAAQASEPDPIALEPLTQRHVFTDGVTARITVTPQGLDEKVMELDDISRLAVVEITVQPGAVFPWHTHPGPILVPVVQGEFVYVYAEDCVERSYPAGTAFVDPGFGNVHTAFNPSSEEETVVVAVFLGAPEEGPLTIPINAEEAATLDERCEIERPDGAGTHSDH